MWRCRGAAESENGGWTQTSSPRADAASTSVAFLLQAQRLYRKERWTCIKQQPVAKDPKGRLWTYHVSEWQVEGQIIMIIHPIVGTPQLQCNANRPVCVGNRCRTNQYLSRTGVTGHRLYDIAPKIASGYFGSRHHAGWECWLYCQSCLRDHHILSVVKS